MQVTWQEDISDPSLVVDPGTQVVDPSGVLHIRGLTTSGAPVTGDLVGADVLNVFNADIRLATGNGRFWGTARFEGTVANRSVDFDSEYRGEITGGLISGRHRGEGSEIRIEGTQEETFPGSLVLNFSSEVRLRDLLPGRVQTILSLPVGDSPEGIALDKHGNIYVGNRNRRAGEVSEILRITRDGAVSVFATLPVAVPEAEGILGLATDPTGNVYAAYVTLDPATQGVYRISHNGSAMERLAGSQNISFANALVFDARGNLYVTDSFVGSVWRFGLDGTAELWVQHDLLEPLPFDPFGFPVPGANGIAFYPPNHLYVANTEKGLIAHIPIELHGGNAGTPELVAAGFDLLTIDGIAADTQGDIHGVVPGFTILGTSPLIRVDPTTGEVTPTVSDSSEAAKFDVPLSLAFGMGVRDRKSVFVTNGDLALPGNPLGNPGPGVVQAGVGVPGFTGR